MHLLSEPFPPTRRGTIRSTPARACLLYVYAHDRNAKLLASVGERMLRYNTSRSQKRKDSEMYIQNVQWLWLGYFGNTYTFKKTVTRSSVIPVPVQLLRLWIG